MLNSTNLIEKIIEIEEFKNMPLFDPRNKELELTIIEKEVFKKMTHAYVVYDRDERYMIRVVLGSRIKELECWEGFLREFDEYAKLMAPKTIQDFMFFLDMYDRSRIYSFPMRTIYDREFTKELVVDQILCDSQGFLLWKYQLANLLGCLVYDNTRPAEAVKILNGVSLIEKEHIPEKENFLEETKGMKINENLTLYDVLLQRTVGNPCLRLRVPMWRYAHNLCMALGAGA